MTSDTDLEDLKSRVEAMESDRKVLFDRLAKLEKRLNGLETVIRSLPQSTRAREPNPLDKESVTEKVKFDWQGDRT